MSDIELASTDYVDGKASGEVKAKTWVCFLNEFAAECNFDYIRDDMPEEVEKITPGPILERL